MAFDTMSTVSKKDFLLLIKSDLSNFKIDYESIDFCRGSESEFNTSNDDDERNFSIILGQVFLYLRDLLVETVFIRMQDDFIVLPDIILIASCQYSNSDTKQFIPLFDENLSNISLYDIGKYVIYSNHFEISYYIPLSKN